MKPIGLKVLVFCAATAASLGLVACSAAPKSRVISSETDDMHSGMHKIEYTWDRLMESRKNGWQSVTGKTALNPVEDAGLLASGFRALQSTKDAQKSEEMRLWLAEAEQIAAALHEQLKTGDMKGAETSYLLALDSCQKCHDVYR